MLNGGHICESSLPFECAPTDMGHAAAPYEAASLRTLIMESLSSTESQAAASPANASLKTLTMIIYGLYGASCVVGVTALVAIIVNYIKRDEVANTIYDSHFRWQMRTFWFGLLWMVVGFITFFFVIGWFVLIANAVWIIYRLVRGFLNLLEDRPMYA